MSPLKDLNSALMQTQAEEQGRAGHGGIFCSIASAENITLDPQYEIGNEQINFLAEAADRNSGWIHISFLYCVSIFSRRKEGPWSHDLY